MIARTIRYRGLTARVVDGPEACKPPAVLLHGMGLGRWLWERFQDEAAGWGVPTVALDLPGHGDDVSNPRLDDALDAVEAAVREIGPCTVVGHSFGGYVAQVVAARVRTRGLALVGAFPTGGTAFWPTRTQLATSPGHVPSALLGKRFYVRYEEYVASGLHALPEAERHEVFARIGPWPGRIVRSLAFRPHRVTAEQIGAPVLVMHGALDRVVAFGVGTRLGRHLGARVWRYDDVGHFPMLEEAGRRVDADLAGWLATRDAAEG